MAAAVAFVGLPAFAGHATKLDGRTLGQRHELPRVQHVAGGSQPQSQPLSGGAVCRVAAVAVMAAGAASLSQLRRQRRRCRHQLEQAVIRRARGGQEAVTGLSEVQQLEAEDSTETFVWRKAWYPLLAVEDVDDTRPTKIQLLGDDLVAWKDGDGEWRVFEDRCPHRAVPLSEGRVESDGTLMCSYHGWRFSGDGKLAALPQATDQEMERIKGNSRACAAARPCQVRQNVLWVWGESGENAALESALKEPNNVKEMEDPALEGRAKMSHWAHRDIPYGWEVAFENVTDPAHVAVSHHNIVSNRYKDPKPFTIEFLRKPTNQEGFSFKTSTGSIMDFRPPAQLHIKQTFDKGAYLKLIINFVPTKPGWTRLVGSTLLVSGEDGSKPKGFGPYSLPLPRWLNHLMAPLFLHQDQVFLHAQQALLLKQQKKTGKKWLDTYWMPTQQDKGVIALRRWLDKNGAPDWSPAAKAMEEQGLLGYDIEDPEKLFDVWTTHTSQCTTCLKALKRVSFAAKAMKYSAITLGAAGVAGAGWPYLVGGAALGLGANLASKLKKMFYTQPYNHQDNN